MEPVDGRIDCAMTEEIDSSDVYYEALNEHNCDSTLEGRVTMQMHYDGDCRPKPTAHSPKHKHVYRPLRQQRFHHMMYPVNGSDAPIKADIK